MKTNKKKIILFVFIALLVLALAVWLVIFINKKTGEEKETRLQNLFPFGEILSGIGISGGANQNSEGSESQEQENQETPDTSNSGLQLRLINPEPTGGMIPLVRIEEIETSTVTTNEEGIDQITTETVEVKNSFIRFSEIDDGSVFETRMTGENIYNEELIVENFLPNAEYSYFSLDGSRVAYQYWSKDSSAIETYLGHIQSPETIVPACPFDISGSIVYGQENTTAFNIHRLLNLTAATQVASSGVNSKGNETALASDLTKQAIIRFQTMRSIPAEGVFGPKTRSEMLNFCNEYQKAEAEQRERENPSARFQITGQFLPQNIISIAMDPAGKTMFYITKTAAGIIGSLRTWADNTAKTIFNSPFSEWASVWNNQESIELHTKPSHLVQGYSYHLKVSTGDYRKSFQQRFGLTSLPSPDNAKVLVYDVESGTPRLSIFDRVSGSFSPLVIQSFTDKCVWSPDSLYIYCGVPDSLAFGGEYPDIWYQGLESYQDSIYRIHVASLEEELLSNIPVDYGQGIDIERIMIDEQELFLYFINKKDESLWSYRLVK